MKSPLSILLSKRVGEADVMSERAWSPWPDDSPRRKKEHAPALPAIKTGLPCIVVSGGGDLPDIEEDGEELPDVQEGGEDLPDTEEEVFRPRASTFPGFTSNSLRLSVPARHVLSHNHLPDIQEEDFRPRASSFHGFTEDREQKLPALRVGSPMIVHSASAEDIGDDTSRTSNLKSAAKNASFKKSITKVINDFREKKNSLLKNAPNAQEFPILTSIYRKSVFDEMSGPSKPVVNAVRKCSLASAVGLAVYRKIYNAELDAYAQKQLKKSKKASKLSADIVDEWDLACSDDENNEEDLEERLPTFFMGQSGEAQVASLKCYEEKLKGELEGEYPQYKQHIGCPALMRQRRALHLDHSEENGSDAAKPRCDQSPGLGGEFVKVTNLMDAVKVERGEQVTSQHYTTVHTGKSKGQRTRDRPKSKTLVNKYNTWANSWTHDST